MSGEVSSTSQHPPVATFAHSWEISTAACSFKSANQKKKRKDTPSGKSVQSVGVRVHTPPRLHYLRYGWASGIVQCLCLSEGFDLRSFLSTVTPCARQLRRHADPTRNLACIIYQQPFSNEGAFRVMCAVLIGESTPNAHHMPQSI